MDAEAAMIRRWQAGDSTAFGAIVERWQQPIARFIARMLGPTGPTADLTQDVFMKAHQAIGRYRHEGTFSTWLFRIALNVVRDACRRHHRQPLPLPAEVVAGHEHAPEPWEQRERSAVLERVLAELPESLRVVLVLRLEGTAFEAMSRVLDIPASTLKSRYGVALRHVRDRLQELGYGLGEP